jgi:hypothetical protein
MARIEESVEINCPAGKVFPFTTDAGRWPDWQSFVVSAEQTSPGAVAVGATFSGVVRLLGLSMKWTGKATEFQPDRIWAKAITSGGFKIVEHLVCDDVDGRTRFTIVFDIEAGGFMRLVSPLLVGAMRRDTKKSLVTLKGILEA